MSIQIDISQSKKIPMTDVSEMVSSQNRIDLDNNHKKLGILDRIPQGERMFAGCGRNWLNLCGARL